MTKINKFELVRQAVLEKISLAGSLNQAAKELGISPSHIINIREASQGKVSDKTINMLIGRLNIQIGWQLAETDNFKRVYSLCRFSQINRVSRALLARPGSGKSFALKQYAATNANVYYIECEEYHKKKYFLQELAETMGINTAGLTQVELTMRVISHLNRNENSLLIIDEAGELTDPVLKLFKTFHNKANAAIILSGTPSFEKRIDRGIRLSKVTIEEIFSRFGREYLRLKTIDEKAIRQIAEANGIHETNDVNSIINTANDDLRRVKTAIEAIKLHKSLENEAISDTKVA